MSFCTQKLSSDKAIGHSFHYWTAFALCFLAILIRGWPRLADAHFWAEDGQVFFAEGLQFGLSSLFIPYFGSYHTIQRLIALAVIQIFPVAWWPTAVCITCYLTTAAVAATLVRETHAWIVPSRAARYGGAFLLCFGPGLGEMLGNICNLNWMLLFWMGLLALRNPKHRLSALDLATSTLIILSVGTTVLSTPLFAWRVYKTSTNRQIVPNQRNRELALLALIVSTAIWFTILNRQEFVDQAESNQLVGRMMADGPALLWSYAYRYFVVGPWSSATFANEMTESMITRVIPFTLMITVCIFTAWLAAVRRSHALMHVILFAAGFVLWPILGWIARPGSIDVFYDMGMLVHNRYSYPAGAAAVVFWLAMIRPEGSLCRGISRIALMFIVLGIGFKTSRSWVYSYAGTHMPPEKSWTEISPPLAASLKTGCPPHVILPIFPERWNMPYIVPAPPSDCE